MDKNKNVQEVAMDILATSVYMLEGLKSDTEQYLKYAQGVHKMCIEYSRAYE